MIRYLVIFLTLMTLLISSQCFGVCWFDDTFTGDNGDPPDAIRWTEYDSGNAMDIQNDTLAFDGSGVTHSSWMNSNCYIPAEDFDIQVSFGITLLEEPDIHLANYPAGLRIYNADNSKWIFIARCFDWVASNGYAREGSNDPWLLVSPYVHGTGKLRFTRTGSTIKGFWWNGAGAQWEWDGNAAGYTFNTSWSGKTYVSLWFLQTENTDQISYLDDFTNNGCVYECEPEYIAPKLIMITKNKEIK